MYLYNIRACKLIFFFTFKSTLHSNECRNKCSKYNQVYMFKLELIFLDKIPSKITR